LGVQGAQGVQGSQGSNGSNGSQGAQGAQGVQGALGAQGDQGVQGADGAQGAAGSGSQGVQGNQGYQGVQGTQGIQGAVGSQGVQGAQGVQGSIGAQGYQGAQGVQGFNGTQGAIGVQGAQGVQGATGSFTGTTSLQINTSNNNASTSTSTGALVATGGAGIGGDLYVGGNVYTTGVTLNGQPTTYGYVNGAYLLAQNTSDQSTGQNVAVNFQTTNASNGSIITKPSNSQVTLTAGNTYKLEAIVRRLTSSSTWGAFRWYDVTNAAFVGIEGFSEVVTGSSAIGSTNVATAYVTPSVNTTYELRQTTVNTISVSANYATIEIIQVNPTIAVQATATGTINNQYASITNGTDISITTGVAKDVTFDTVTASSGIPYSTSTGVFTLTSGVTYRFTGELSFAGYTGYALYQLVDATTNTPVNNQTSANPSYNSGFAEANNNTYDAIYTPSTNQTVKFRVTGSSFTGTGVIRGGYYGRINVQQINNAFALNALDTMTTTGNVTVGGNLTVTGNVTGNVATTFESTWTVPTGNSTQSFTVTAGNTYSMWVDCNIPNGILVWNATATVTNTNVPVVGVQYAWVYNGGGTPIDFTSIPNQFTGTANAIVRSNVAPSATTNRFDFGINNTSGNAVAVRYGWAQIS